MGKKRTKKHNPNKKRNQLDKDEVVKGTGIYQIPHEPADFFHVESGKLLPGKYMKDTGLSHLYVNRKFTWTVGLVLFLINDEGYRKIEVDHLVAKDCKADEIQDFVKDYHDKMIAKADPKAYIAAGWFALPYHEYVSSVTLMKLFDDTLHVWDKFITNKGNELNEYKND